jgi:hypothetical protein
VYREYGFTLVDMPLASVEDRLAILEQYADLAPDA